MFISEELAQERLRSSENILNRAKRGDDYDDVGPIPLPPSSPDVPEEEERAQAPEGVALRKLLDGDPGILRRKHRTLEVQASIGLTNALLGGGVASRLHDISPMQSNNYRHGYTNTDDRVAKADPKKELLRAILEKNGIVIDLAFDRLIKSMELMDDDKLAKIMSPEKLARIAQTMSQVMKNASPKEADDSAPGGIHFHVWRPEMKQDADYPVIEVGGVNNDNV